MMSRWRRGQGLEFEVVDPKIPDKPPQFVGGTLQDGVPEQEHLLVVPEPSIQNLSKKLAGRQYEPYFYYPWQGLMVYKVAARQTTAANRTK
jgi:hypothetical protein